LHDVTTQVDRLKAEGKEMRNRY